MKVRARERRGGFDLLRERATTNIVAPRYVPRMRAAVTLLLTLCACERATPPVDAAVPHDVRDAATKLTDAPTDAADAPNDDAPFTLPPYEDPWACPSSAARPPLDEALDASQSRAGEVRAASELLGGEAAAGRVGHFKLYSQRARFIIQGRVDPAARRRAVGYDLYGGNLIDADRARPRGQPGGDLFHETFPVFGFRTGTVDEVTVVCDGSNGRPAAVRVRGRDANTRLISVLDSLARPREVELITHYVLAPGSEVLEIVTEARALQGGAVALAQSGDFLGFGAVLALFTEATGFGDAGRATAPITWLAGVSDPGEGDRRVSYAMGPASGPMTVPVVDASGTIALYANVSAPAGGVARFTRYFSVGDGDVNSAVEPLLNRRRDPHGTVTGTTTPGALVYAYRGTYAPGATARNVSRAGADGAFRLALTAGDYQLVAVDEGRVRGAPVPVTVRDGANATASPTAGETGTLVLDLTVRDGDAVGRAPVKVSLEGVDVERPDGALGELEGERESYGQHRVVFSLRGDERVTVKPGRYRARVSRGPEYEVTRAEVTVPARGEATLRAEVVRVLETRGYVSGDFHQHTVGSIDSPRGLCGRVLENVAEGLEYAATTDHDNVTDFMPCARALGLTARFNAVSGNEISVIGVGHFNAYPLRVDPADPSALIGAQYWADTPTQALFDRIRGEAGGPILHLSHPRSNNLKGYFTSIGLDPTTTMSRIPLATGWEALEVNESLGAPAEFLASGVGALRTLAARDPARVAVAHDWFALLNRGEHPCALGNSDTHERNGASGYPRNYLRVGTNEPAMVTEERLREAIRAQRVVVSNGVVVDLRVNGMDRMGWREVVTAPGEVVLEVTVQAPSWVRLDTLAVFENGRPLTRAMSLGGNEFRVVEAMDGSAPLTWSLAEGGAATPAARWRGTFRARPSRDAWYVAVVRGGPLAPVGGGDAFGYTNPVYVDVDGGGFRAVNAP